MMIQSKDQKAIEFYQEAHRFMELNFANELKWAEDLTYQKHTPEDFLYEYVWVVLCSGFRVSEARKIFDKWRENISDLSVIKHPLKKKAIKIMLKDYKKCYDKLLSTKGNDAKLAYLRTLSHIGPITQFHLAKNLGMDVIKPDVHLTRLASNFYFRTPDDMVQLLQNYFQHSKRVIDSVLWRYCEQTRSYKEATKG